FEKTLALNPSEIMVIYNMGLIHQINHQPEKAILFLRKAHGIDPQIFEVELLLGHLLFKNKNHQDALPHLEKAAQLKPESSLALTIKADILLEQEELQRAGQIYGRAIKNRPGNARAISGYALSMALQGKNMGIALSFARESTLLDPESKLFRTRLNTIKALAEQKEKDASAKSA
ncbi:MAG: tetratricopeptide repeat protein, partial [Desulfovibrionales bacterium]|nr:tetratricopeptide repeat protein [Desulfovibrionales bacterium]